ALHVLETVAELRIYLDYRRDLFDAPTIARLSGHLQALLAAAAEDPARPLSALPVLSAAERQQLLREWNDTASEYPHAETVAAGFAAQAARTPAAVAVAMGERQVAYAELASGANRLARALQARGVAPETPVAI